MSEFRPEGALFNTPENKRHIRNLKTLAAAPDGMVLEAVCVLCDSGHNLIIELTDGTRLCIPREEGAIGIREGLTRDIALISRVYKPVCFKVSHSAAGITLSRRAAQAEASSRYLALLSPGDVIPAKVTRLERFGAFADVCRGIVSLIPIDSISVSRISDASERFHSGEDIFAAVKTRWNAADLRMTLTHRELLGTFEQNAALFNAHETVRGIVRSVEEYGVFVELMPNLAGLAELRSGSGFDSGVPLLNRPVSVYIKSVSPQKMKIKLSLVELFAENAPLTQRQHYFITEGNIGEWEYSPPGCEKWIGTQFGG